MVKLSELRLGNWLLGNNGQPYRITRFTFDEYLSEGVVPYQPYPLSLDLLIEIQFKIEQNENLYICTINKDCFFFQIIFDPYLREFRFDSPHFDICKKGLHKLQNLYFQMTEEELKVPFEDFLTDAK